MEIAAAAADKTMTDWEDNPGASTPRLAAVNYGGRNRTISGDADTVARIHRTDRTFDLFETATLAALASVVTAMSALMVMYAPDGREFLVLGLSVTGWVLALGLSGYTAIRIKASKSGLDIGGRTPANPLDGRR